MPIETKDLRILKTDYGHRIKAVDARVYRLEQRVGWVEKLLWLSAGAVISWLVTWLIRGL
jgi:endonuclease III